MYYVLYVGYIIRESRLLLICSQFALRKPCHIKCLSDLFESYLGQGSRSLYLEFDKTPETHTEEVALSYIPRCYCAYQPCLHDVSRSPRVPPHYLLGLVFDTSRFSRFGCKDLSRKSQSVFLMTVAGSCPTQMFLRSMRLLCRAVPPSCCESDVNTATRWIKDKTVFVPPVVVDMRTFLL
jgi:hypothetical protein